ncbi:MAG TPA: hypothetical protein V6C76_00020 [Drouetiella sp.]
MIGLRIRITDWIPSSDYGSGLRIRIPDWTQSLDYCSGLLLWITALDYESESLIGFNRRITGLVTNPKYGLDWTQSPDYRSGYESELLIGLNHRITDLNSDRNYYFR